VSDLNEISTSYVVKLCHMGIHDANSNKLNETVVLQRAALEEGALKVYSSGQPNYQDPCRIS
jgi:hypothetical protein